MVDSSWYVGRSILARCQAEFSEAERRAQSERDRAKNTPEQRFRTERDQKISKKSNIVCNLYVELRCGAGPPEPNNMMFSARVEGIDCCYFLSQITIWACQIFSSE